MLLDGTSLQPTIVTPIPTTALQSSRGQPWALPRAPTLAATHLQVVASSSIDGASEVLRLARGSNLNTVPEEVTRRLEELAAGIQLTPNAAALALEQGQGTWEVFHAPHMRRLGPLLLGARFDPVRYTLRPDGTLTTNVRMNSPLVGPVWLSCSGVAERMEEEGGGPPSLRTVFDRFWFDVGEDALRPELEGEGTPLDKAVSAAGRTAFVPGLAVFPIRYASAELWTFSFPPLDVDISIRRVAQAVDV